MKPSTAQATTPLRRFAQHSTGTCAVQASAYGKCILGTYNDVRKDSCREEFARFGACLREAVSTPFNAREKRRLMQIEQMKRSW